MKKDYSLLLWAAIIALCAFVSSCGDAEPTAYEKANAAYKAVLRDSFPHAWDHRTYYTFNGQPDTCRVVFNEEFILFDDDAVEGWWVSKSKFMTLDSVIIAITPDRIAIFTKDNGVNILSR